MKACRRIWQIDNHELLSMQRSMTISVIAHSLGSFMRILL